MHSHFRNFSHALLLAGTSALALAAQSDAALAAKGLQIQPNSLVVLSTTYDKTQGPIANLTPGTTVLAHSATATSTAVADNNFVNVWNNASVDGNFGVTSPITLLDVNPGSGTVRHTIQVPTSQVVTSFSSKSEGGINITTDSNGGLHAVFIGYGKAGVGALDVSNSDAVAGQDPTNPVTFAFGTAHTFPRTIVSMDAMGNFKYTPTIAYGGDNGRSALLGSNGLYYTVGNSNNGNASTFGPGNGTNPDVTETTGLEVVNPIDGASAFVTIPAGNSAEVNPTLQFTVNGKLDKAGKDTNFRGITEFGGALYFSKGSGSNGINSLYTAPLATVANAGATAVSIVPGFPTDFAKVSGGDFAPFGVFFADTNTAYVADEGSTNTTDATTHAGLQKWSRVNGTWQLDYVLTKGLIGTVDTNLNGPDGKYPDVTTTGLRNLTGHVHGNGVVTLWATTATSSASGDVGANPNRVVSITDSLAATTMTKKVSNETFKTVLAPKYGTVYRGVAYAQ